MPLKLLVIITALSFLLGCGGPSVSLRNSVKSGNLDSAKSLAVGVTDLNWIDGLGDGYLHYAAARGDLKMIEFLLQSGADVNNASAFGKTALTIAIENNSYEIIDFLLSKNVSVAAVYPGAYSPLMVATALRDETSIDKILTQPVDINYVDFSKTSAAFIAALNNDHDILEKLISHDADLNIQTVFGWTPLNAAAFRGNRKIFSLLLDHGAIPNNVNIRSFQGSSESFKETLMGNIHYTTAKTNWYMGENYALEGNRSDAVRSLSNAREKFVAAENSFPNPVLAEDGHCFVHLGDGDKIWKYVSTNPTKLVTSSRLPTKSELETTLGNRIVDTNLWLGDYIGFLNPVGFKIHHEEVSAINICGIKPYSSKNLSVYAPYWWHRPFVAGAENMQRRYNRAMAESKSSASVIDNQLACLSDKRTAPSKCVTN